jgi:hypothetical protein
MSCFSFVYIYICGQEKKKKNNMCDRTTKNSEQAAGEFDRGFCLFGQYYVYISCV